MWTYRFTTCFTYFLKSSGVNIFDKDKKKLNDIKKNKINFFEKDLLDFLELENKKKN